MPALSFASMPARDPAVRRLSLAAGAAAAALASCGGGGLRAQTPLVLRGGPPVQVQPAFPEPGLPLITISPGTANPFAGLGGGAGVGDPGGGGNGSGAGGGSAGSNDVLPTLLGTSWGAQAVNAAQSLGVNPSALAATCVVETSTCGNVTNSAGATGPFQMFGPAFRDGLRTALAANPSLSSQIAQGSSGINDPYTQSVAASGYLLQATQVLEANGIANPTFVDARGYYQFGPTYGPRIAQSDGSATISSIVPQNWLAQNGISPAMTVDQWRSSVASRVGNAANQPIRS